MAPSMLVGTSGYAHDSWRGSFYPSTLERSGWLRFYASQFPVVEVNTSFYRMPTAPTLANWQAQVQPPTAAAPFLFALQAPQAMTYDKRLHDIEEHLQSYFNRAAELGPSLAASLFQLPPFLKKDLAKLTMLLSSTPPGQRVAVEFHHPSWFDDAVYSCLHQHNAALCLNDTDRADSPTPPREVTASWGYIRLRRHAYTTAELRRWKTWLEAQNWQQTMIFFKHEGSDHAPHHAQQLLQLLRPTAIAPT